MNYGPFVLVSKKTFPVEGLPALLAKLKAEGPTINVAHAAPDPARCILRPDAEPGAGTRFNYVPYRGTVPR